jgi:hypothetical protein
VIAQLERYPEPSGREDLACRALETITPREHWESPVSLDDRLSTIERLWGPFPDHPPPESFGSRIPAGQSQGERDNPIARRCRRPPAASEHGNTE